MDSLEIKNVKRADLPLMKEVIDSNELFPSEMLDDMTADYFNNPLTRDLWLVAKLNSILVGLCYCAPERLTEGTYNLYLIAVSKDYQGLGVGGKLMMHVEGLLKERGARILLVETSSLPEFELTRKFYDKSDYTREAVIRHFYKEGEDKIVFWKNLTT